MTAAVWVRGFLLHGYGVAPEAMTWVLGDGPHHQAAGREFGPH
jgi:hypothetical protein